MRRQRKIVLWIVLALVIMRCSEDNMPSNCHQAPIVAKGNSSKGFFSNGCPLYDTSQEEAFFVIQNLSQLVETVNCDQDFPEIDFEKHTLLLGNMKNHPKFPGSFIFKIACERKRSDLLAESTQQKGIVELIMANFTNMSLRIYNIYP